MARGTIAIVAAMRMRISTFPRRAVVTTATITIRMSTLASSKDLWIALRVVTS
jgi:hypothetical protein